ncbi:hypothetical protein [Pseudomonas putida]|uniref:Transmembrane protein n=1 Tax=Pseudomonas putida TaxID=303 RepID=A0A1Q9R2G1_PSEPU|nr:hypothetical protein [Pseudomonas putida]OLS61482.1 hypothetical protein PSEMO_35490 [Pseudomonas putida]
MNRLTAPRIALTLVALVGLLPVTLLFLYGIVAVFIPMAFIEPNVRSVTWALGICAISSFSLWSGWRIYALAKASEPVMPKRWLLIAGGVACLVWSVVVGGAFWPEVPKITALFLMPGVSTSLMLGVLLWRERTADHSRAAATRPSQP